MCIRQDWKRHGGDKLQKYYVSRNLILQDSRTHKQFVTNNLHASLAGVPPLWINKFHFISTEGRKEPKVVKNCGEWKTKRNCYGTLMKQWNNNEANYRKRFAVHSQQECLKSLGGCTVTNRPISAAMRVSRIHQNGNCNVHFQKYSVIFHSQIQTQTTFWENWLRHWLGNSENYSAESNKSNKLTRCIKCKATCLSRKLSLC